MKKTSIILSIAIALLGYNPAAKNKNNMKLTTPAKLNIIKKKLTG